jgi:Fic family protein
MVYHEIREVNGKKQNYLIYNKRENDKWVKQSKFIGTGEISKEEIRKEKKKFELELILNKNYKYLAKKQVEEMEKLRQIYFEKVDKLSKEEFERFEHSFFTELTYNSNAIEGSSLSLEDTSLVIDEHLAPKGKTVREIHEAENHIRAIKFMNSYKGELNEEFILRLHGIILKDISERFAGRYRESEIRIFGSAVKFPRSDIVPQLVKGLVYWYNKYKKEYHPFEMAVIFSIKFVSIHPFVDGNGRMSRLLMNFILKKNKYPWINVYMKQREDYLKAVRKSNDEDYSVVLEFMIKTLRENLREFGFL